MSRAHQQSCSIILLPFFISWSPTSNLIFDGGWARACLWKSIPGFWLRAVSLTSRVSLLGLLIWVLSQFESNLFPCFSMWPGLASAVFFTHIYCFPLSRFIWNTLTKLGQNSTLPCWLSLYMACFVSWIWNGPTICSCLKFGTGGGGATTRRHQKDCEIFLLSKYHCVLKVRMILIT